MKTLKMARYIQILCLSTLNLINHRNVSHIKLSKYCDIDARLRDISYISLSKLNPTVYHFWHTSDPLVTYGSNCPIVSTCTWTSLHVSSLQSTVTSLAIRYRVISCCTINHYSLIGYSITVCTHTCTCK